VVFCNDNIENNLWIPRRKEVSIEHFGDHQRLAYMIGINEDFLGLKKVFNNYGCDFVQAHNLWCAYYSYKIGLPTIFSDWEYYLNHLDYFPLKSNGQSIFGLPFALMRRFRASGFVKHLLKNIPIIVTNKNQQEKYQSLGAKECFVVPNVPLKFEQDYAFSVNVEKEKVVTTSYIGQMSSDTWALRDASEVPSLWSRFDIGKLHIFEKENYLPHLNVLRKLRSFHFNLLYWKPFPDHKYYLQNKAFMASVVGIPTIISSSLTATINLLGSYAIPVSNLEEIPKIIKHYEPVSLPLQENHLWEYYESNIKKAYCQVKN